MEANDVEGDDGSKPSAELNDVEGDDGYKPSAEGRDAEGNGADKPDVEKGVPWVGTTGEEDAEGDDIRGCGDSSNLCFNDNCCIVFFLSSSDDSSISSFPFLSRGVR